MNKNITFELESSLRHPLYFILMRSPEIHQGIEKRYLADEEHYKNLLKNMNSTDHFFHGIQTNDKWNILMLKAILMEIEAESKEAYNEFVLDLIKTSYKRIYDYTQRNPVYNQYLFGDYIKNREPNVTDEKMYLYGLIYLYVSKDMPNFNMSDTPLDRIVSENLYLMNMDVDEVNKQIALTDIEKAEALKVYQELTGERWRNNEPKQLTDIITNIEVHMLKSRPALNRRINLTGNTRLSYELKPLSYLRHSLSLIQMYGYDNKSFLYELAIGKEDWFLLYKNYLRSKEGKGFAEEDRDELLMFSIVQYVQHVAYRKLEDTFWEMKLSENVSEIRSEQKVLDEERIALKHEKEKFEREKMKLEEQMGKQLNAKDEELTSLKKELDLLILEKEKLAEQVALMPVLRDAVFNKKQDEDFVEVDVSTEVKELVAGKKLVLVGGHDTFRKKMSEHFDNLYTIAPEDKSVGLTQVRNADVILFDTGYNNHNQFDRLKNVITKEQVIVFLNDITSIKRVELEMMRRLKANSMY